MSPIVHVKKPHIPVLGLEVRRISEKWVVPKHLGPGVGLFPGVQSPLKIIEKPNRGKPNPVDSDPLTGNQLASLFYHGQRPPLSGGFKGNNPAF